MENLVDEDSGAGLDSVAGADTVESGGGCTRGVGACEAGLVDGPDSVSTAAAASALACTSALVGRPRFFFAGGSAGAGESCGLIAGVDVLGLMALPPTTGYTPGCSWACNGRERCWGWGW
jgi:hypothetical protein